METLGQSLVEGWGYTPTPPRKISQSTGFRKVDCYDPREEPEEFLPSNLIEFFYEPELYTESKQKATYKTNWISEINYVTLTAGDIYQRDIDLDGGYVITGAFVDPIVTDQAEKIIEALMAAIPRVTTAVDVTMAIERLWTKIERNGDWKSLTHAELEGLIDEMAALPDTLTSPLQKVNGIGEETEKRMAQEFGTYQALAKAEQSAIPDRYHKADLAEIIAIAKKAVDAYEIWVGENNGENEIPISDLMSYPKEHPHLTMRSQEAGRPNPDWEKHAY
jgi:hypothetical protein